MSVTVVLKRRKYHIERHQEGRRAPQFRIVIPANQAGHELSVWIGPRGYLWAGPVEGHACGVVTVDLVDLENALANAKLLSDGKKVR